MKQEIGGLVPEIELLSMDGAKRSLSSFLEGKRGTVIVFWSDTCSHCMRYDNYLNHFTESHPEIGFFAIASRTGEDPDSIRATVTERGLTFPILHDAGAKVAREWLTRQTPRAFLIDSGRRLLYRGAIDNFRYLQDPEYEAYLEPAIEDFLTGQPIRRPETASFGCAVQAVYYNLPKALA